MDDINKYNIAKYRSIDKKLSKIKDKKVVNEYLNWLDTKTTFFADSINKRSYRPQPDNIIPGDVIWVEFGINIGAELSDFSTNGHYAVVILVSLGNLVVIPLTSKDNNDSSFCFNLGIIDELCINNKCHSYLKLDAIRSVSKRRVGRMINKNNGKIHLSDKVMKKINKAIKNSLLNY